jgi:hypothetical protein
MQSLKIKAEVKPDHSMTAVLPDMIPAGEHEFILVYQDVMPIQAVDLMQFSGTLDWPEDGLAYQQNIRNEWDSRLP